MAFPFTLYGYLLITFAMVIGSALQGTVGYGSALVAAPLLLLVDQRLVPVPFSLSIFILVILMTVRERRALDLKGLTWSVFGRVFGSGLGALILVQFASDSFVLIFSIMVLLAVIISASGVRFYPSIKALIGAGFFSGLMGTIAAIGGPPMALVYQEEDGERLRSTLSAYFIVSIIISGFAWLSVGMLGVEHLFLVLLLLPGILIGYFLSSKIVPIIRGNYLRPLILIVAAVSAIYALINHLIF